MKETLHQAIDTVLDEPFYQITVPLRPRNWLDKIRFKWRQPNPKTYQLHSLTGGNAYRVSRKLLDIPEASIKQGTDAMLRDMFKLHTGHVETLAYVVAVSITNNRQEPPESLIQALLWDIPESQLREAAKAVMNNFNVKDFTYTIVSIAGMDIISPKETGPQVPGKPSAES